jgi:hypothetical protein
MSFILGFSTLVTVSNVVEDDLSHAREPIVIAHPLENFLGSCMPLEWWFVKLRDPLLLEFWWNPDKSLVPVYLV